MNCCPLPVAYHPLLWFTRARIMESREMICDEMASEVDGQQDYARSLLRLARLLIEGAPAITPHTIGIFDADIFERRIMNLTRKQNQLTLSARAGLMAAGHPHGAGHIGDRSRCGLSMCNPWQRRTAVIPMHPTSFP